MVAHNLDQSPHVHATICFKVVTHNLIVKEYTSLHVELFISSANDNENFKNGAFRFYQSLLHAYGVIAKDHSIQGYIRYAFEFSNYAFGDDPSQPFMKYLLNKLNTEDIAAVHEYSQTFDLSKAGDGTENKAVNHVYSIFPCSSFDSFPAYIAQKAKYNEAIGKVDFMGHWGASEFNTFCNELKKFAKIDDSKFKPKLENSMVFLFLPSISKAKIKLVQQFCADYSNKE